MVQSSFLTGAPADSGREQLLEVLGLAGDGREVVPVSADSIGVALVLSLVAVVGDCLSLANGDERSRGRRWSRRLRCSYNAGHWYQEVHRRVGGRTGVELLDCHGQQMFVLDGSFGVSVKWVNHLRLSVRNRTWHSYEILYQSHRVEGLGPLRFWELAYRFSPRWSLSDVRFQYRVGRTIRDFFPVAGLLGDRYDVLGDPAPVAGGSGEAAAPRAGRRDIYDF